MVRRCHLSTRKARVPDWWAQTHLTGENCQLGCRRRRLVTSSFLCLSLGPTGLRRGRAERAYSFVFPFRAFEFRQYGEFLSQMFTQHLPDCHDVVVRFDRAMRRRIGSRNDLRFYDFAQFSDLQRTHLLPSGTQLLATRPSRAFARGRSVKPPRNEPCRKFNQGACKRSIESCKYTHVCTKCGVTGRGSIAN